MTFPLCEAYKVNQLFCEIWVDYKNISKKIHELVLGNYYTVKKNDEDPKDKEKLSVMRKSKSKSFY
jgi:uncharacterized ubiquitin-like protein YukD